MNSKRLLRSVILFAILAVNIGCDQLSKHVARQRIGDNERISVVANYVTLMKVENEGAFLSLGTSLPKTVRFILLSLLPLAVLGFGVGYLFTKTSMSWLSAVGFAFVIGGGMGNLYDRLLYGSVTDFLHIDFIIFQTGIFNMADVSIMTGMGMVILDAFHKKVKHQPLSTAGEGS
jgi:signal peptidase II